MNIISSIILLIILLIIIIIITSIIMIIILNKIDHNFRLKLSQELKIGSKCRVFTTETDFKIVQIMEINKNTAICKYNNGDIEKILLIDLVY